jgi:hypothetical protein
MGDPRAAPGRLTSYAKYRQTLSLGIGAGPDLSSSPGRPCKQPHVTSGTRPHSCAAPDRWCYDQSRAAPDPDPPVAL